MNSRILSLLLTLASATIMAGATADSLDLKSSGDIDVATDSLGDLRIVIGVNETSQGVWHGLSPRQKASPSAGKAVEGEMIYAFPDGSEVTMTVSAKIEGSNVAVRYSWVTESTAKGFAMLTLMIPADAAKDLTIEADGKPMFSNFNKSAYLPKVSEITFKQTSTGAFLFKLTGEIVGGGTVFNPDKLDDGLQLRIGTSPTGMDSCISDAKETGWTLSFKE
ncbi:MAG: hypothetical protein WCS65_05230 [Verrucomicrobiae bacterium]